MTTRRKYVSRSLVAALLFVLFFVLSNLWPQAAGPAHVDPVPQAIDESVPPASNNYPLGPDSLPHPLTPLGSTIVFSLHSKIFPDSERTITVYVPAAYHGDKPACVYVGLDGLGFHASTVFDNLIAQHAMPVTIAIGVSPGEIPSATPPANPRFNRSYEFDSLSDRLARFLLQEVLPEVARHKTPAGVPILLSNNPNDRAIGGASTEAIAAFTVAWQRPDAFRRVFSSIGTYVGMRGGEQYYVLVRKTEPKPIRIFMQDGVHDEWPGGPEMGDWWMSNQTMNRALEFAGYDVRHLWGTGTHNDSQAASVFPEAMRWLWKDWPAAIAARPSGNPVLASILQPMQDWQAVANTCGVVNSLASNPSGQTFYAAGGALVAVKPPASVAGAEARARCKPSAPGPSFAFGPDGRLYVPSATSGIRVMEAGITNFSAHQPLKILGSGVRVRNLTVRSNGDIYAVTRTHDTALSELSLIHANGQGMWQDASIRGASGLALSPDGLWLFVAQQAGHMGLSYRVRSNGVLDAAQPFYELYVPSGADDSGAGSVAMDRDGRAYVATRMGVQVLDRNGRVAAILPLPGNVAATSLCFGGDGFATLFVAGNGKVYQRKLHVAGAAPWAAPAPLPPWGAG